jgi:hypothetical protein
MVVEHGLPGGRAIELKHAESLGSELGTNRKRHAPRDCSDALEIALRDLEDVVAVLLRDDEGVSGRNREQIHERECVGVLVHLEGRRLTADDQTEDAAFAQSRLPTAIAARGGSM